MTLDKKMFAPALLMFAISIAAPLAAQQTSASRPVTDVDQMQRVEDSWSQAVIKKDQYTLELVLSPLLVDISATGDVTTRNQQVARLVQDGGESLGLDQRVISVRMLGDVAVVNGTYLLRHRVDSRLMDEKGVFSHVFQRVRGNWQCINSQRTLVADQPTQKAKQPAKKSNSELPFHIPLLHKGNAPADQSAPASPSPTPQPTPQP